MEQIAQVYARSLFEVAEAEGKLDVVREQLGQVAEALKDDHDLSIFFFSPYFSTEEKKDGAVKMLEGADPIITNLLATMIENHRMPAIVRTDKVFEDLWQKANKRLPVTITSAIELDERTVQQITGSIGEQTGQTVELTQTVDPEILGGLVVRVGNSIIDASISNRLEQLRRSVARA